MKRIFFTFAALLLTAVPALPAHADGLSLDKVVLDFKPGDKPIDTITVTNQNDKLLKVTVESVEVARSGMPDQKETPAEKLIAAPKSFEIAPGESRPVRLILRGFPDDAEAVYRVRFRPDLPTMEKTKEIDGKEVQVSVIVSMGALILVAPKTPRPDLTFSRAGGIITFTNAGNVTATLQRETFCTEGKQVCGDLEGMRLFPGNTWEMKVPDALKALAFTQTVQMNGKYSTLSYPAP